MLQVDHLSVRLEEKTAVDNVSFTVNAGEWWTLAGPNGAGKTSLAEALTRGVKHSGKIRIDGKDTTAFSAAEFACKVGILSQMNSVMYGFTVREIVEMGRYAHREGFLHGRDPEGGEKVRQALELTGLSELRDRNMLTLSGGETQRVFLAQVLAQDPELLILDEPANHLDLPFQRQFFDLVRSWLESPGRAVITVMHDLNLARRYSTHSLLLDSGKCVAQGKVRKVLSPENLCRVYRMDVYAWMREMLSQWQNETGTEAQDGSGNRNGPAFAGSASEK